MPSVIDHLWLEYRAYLWTLAALVAVYFGTLIAGIVSPPVIGKLEAFGLGTITGGLIGLLRMPRRSQDADGSYQLPASSIVKADDELIS